MIFELAHAELNLVVTNKDVKTAEHFETSVVVVGGGSSSALTSAQIFKMSCVVRLHKEAYLRCLQCSMCS